MTSTTLAKALALQQHPYLASSSSFSSSSSSFQSAISSPEPTPEPFEGSIFGTDTSEDETYAKKKISHGNMITVQPYDIKPPDIPDRSELRRSQAMLLQPMAKEMEGPMSRQTFDHEKYLSSEEDASSSADELSDFDFDFESESESSQEIISWRSSGEIKARAVSVIYCGKPTIVDLPPRPRSVSPVSTISRPFSRLRRKPAESCLSADRAVSTPLRPSSMYNPRSSTPTNEQEGPIFLNTDPFQSKDVPQGNDFSRPMTPTALLKRTFTFAKKNRAAATPAANPLAEGLSFSRRRSEPHIQPQSGVPPPQTNYQDIMRKARRIGRVQTPPVTQSPLSAYSHK